MKRFLALVLIYSLNIIVFLFAKSAGALELEKNVGRSPAIVNIKELHVVRGEYKDLH